MEKRPKNSELKNDPKKNPDYLKQKKKLIRKIAAFHTRAVKTVVLNSLLEVRLNISKPKPQSIMDIDMEYQQILVTVRRLTPEFLVWVLQQVNSIIQHLRSQLKN